MQLIHRPLARGDFAPGAPRVGVCPACGDVHPRFDPALEPIDPVCDRLGPRPVKVGDVLAARACEVRWGGWVDDLHEPAGATLVGGDLPREVDVHSVGGEPPGIAFPDALIARLPRPRMGAPILRLAGQPRVETVIGKRGTRVRFAVRLSDDSALLVLAPGSPGKPRILFRGRQIRDHLRGRLEPGSAVLVDMRAGADVIWDYPNGVGDDREPLDRSATWLMSAGGNEWELEHRSRGRVERALTNGGCLDMLERREAELRFLLRLARIVSGADGLATMPLQVLLNADATQIPNEGLDTDAGAASVQMTREGLLVEQGRFLNREIRLGLADHWGVKLDGDATGCAARVVEDGGIRILHIGLSGTHAAEVRLILTREFPDPAGSFDIYATLPVRVRPLGNQPRVRYSARGLVPVVALDCRGVEVHAAVAGARILGVARMHPGALPVMRRRVRDDSQGREGPASFRLDRKEPAIEDARSVPRDRWAELILGLAGRLEHRLRSRLRTVVVIKPYHWSVVAWESMVTALRDQLRASGIELVALRHEMKAACPSCSHNATCRTYADAARRDGCWRNPAAFEAATAHRVHLMTASAPAFSAVAEALAASAPFPRPSETTRLLIVELASAATFVAAARFEPTADIGHLSGLDALERSPLYPWPGTSDHQAGIQQVLPGTSFLLSTVEGWLAEGRRMLKNPHVVVSAGGRVTLELGSAGSALPKDAGRRLLVELLDVMARTHGDQVSLEMVDPLERLRLDTGEDRTPAVRGPIGHASRPPSSEPVLEVLEAWLTRLERAATVALEACGTAPLPALLVQVGTPVPEVLKMRLLKQLNGGSGGRSCEAVVLPAGMAALGAASSVWLRSVDSRRL